MTPILAAEQMEATQQALAVGGWVGGVLSVIGTVVNAIISARVSRDRLTFDADMALLRQKVVVLEDAVKDAKEGEAREAADHKECRALVDRQQVKIDKLEERIGVMSDWLVRWKGMPAPPPGTGEHPSTPTPMDDRP